MKSRIAWNKGKPALWAKGNKHRLGKTPWNKGKKTSEETLKKLRESHKGYVMPKSQRDAIGNSNRGKKKPPRTKIHSKKIADALRGEKNVNWKGGYENKKVIENHRRLRKRLNGGFHTLSEWQTLKAQYNWTCPSCYKSEPEIKLTKDHIISVSKGGSDNIENIQPLCGSCNSKKGTKIKTY